MTNISKTPSDFTSQGVRCSGILWTPNDTNPEPSAHQQPSAHTQSSANTKPPVIVMAHGFGLIKEAGLPLFAERFVNAGYAVFLFDYRGFGASDGEPRQWVSPRHHLQDWQAAINHVRKLVLVDGNRMALWGSSFSGGHVLQTAAKFDNISAVIAQVPHVSGLASLKSVPLSKLTKLSQAGIQDLLGGFIGKPVYKPIVGRSNDIAAMTTPEAWDGYMALLPDNANWENKTRAQIFLEITLYSPINHAKNITAPTLVIAGKHDSITPYKAAKKAAKKIPNARFELLDSNHFQPYVGDMLKKTSPYSSSFYKTSCPSQLRPQATQHHKPPSIPLYYNLYYNFCSTTTF